MTQKLPLFPLHTVLFPGAPIQLHIFEERYRAMIARCLEQSSPFGVVLLRSGSEVSPDDPWVRQQIEQAGGDPDMGALRQQLGGAAVPHAIGTSAQINAGESVRLPDGRYYVVALGQRRFRVQYLVQRQPYLVGSVAYLPEEVSPDTIVAAQQLRELYRRYWEALGAATGDVPPSETPPDGAIDLTYWLAHRLQVDNARKQHWLETDADTRLREMTAALRRELALLPGRSGPLN